MAKIIFSELFVESLLLYFKWVSKKSGIDLSHDQELQAVRHVLDNITNEKYNELNEELMDNDGNLSPNFQSMANESLLAILE